MGRTTITWWTSHWPVSLPAILCILPIAFCAVYLSIDVVIMACQLYHGNYLGHIPLTTVTPPCHPVLLCNFPVVALYCKLQMLQIAFAIAKHISKFHACCVSFNVRILYNLAIAFFVLCNYHLLLVCAILVTTCYYCVHCTAMCALWNIIVCAHLLIHLLLCAILSTMCYYCVHCETRLFVPICYYIC